MDRGCLIKKEPRTRFSSAQCCCRCGFLKNRTASRHGKTVLRRASKLAASTRISSARKPHALRSCFNFAPSSLVSRMPSAMFQLHRRRQTVLLMQTWAASLVPGRIFIFCIYPVTDISENISPRNSILFFGLKL